MDSFAYVIRDRSRNELLAYSSLTLSPAELAAWPESFNRLVQADDKLRTLRYGTCILGWESERITLVPDELYQPGQASKYLEHLTVLGLNDAVREERFNELEGHLLFASPKDRIEAVERRLNPLRTHHVAGGLLTAWSLRSQRLGHQSVSVALRGNKLFVAAQQNGKLLFFNNFTYASSQDALYFLLLAYQQCGWSPARVPLYLCGEITDHSELYRQFYRYIEDLRFCEYGAPPATPPELASLPGHLYFELLCLG